ncbi:type II toxin-antitoxin system VapC family toxin [uncultured Sphingomonas sp.]|uniref:type II toxin-antitoxin system VapC family toxin n=1 Tax=uncultured Sphingomonas sp. TaxID=158754 RepID=UPI0035CB5F17
MTVVIDAAALMALLLDERGADIVSGIIRGATISTVNISECCARGVERGATAEAVLAMIADYEMRIVDCDLAQAAEAARLREPTRATGSSLGDRMCLALARLRSGTIYTADRRMGSLDGKLGLDIRLIR